MEYINRKNDLDEVICRGERRANIEKSFMDTAGECEDGMNGRREWDKWKR